VDHTFDLLDDYLSDAPSTDYLSEYPVHFVSTTPRTHALLENTNKADSYVWNPQNEQLSLGQRPDVFRNFGMESVFAKKASGRAQDQRAQYKSEKYPWLISVHKFTMQYDFPDDADTTMIEIPKEFPPGQYVIQYMWSGFFDCIDVNILDEPSTDFFGRGSGAGGSSFDRIDHCQYIDTYEGYEIVGDCIGIGANSDATECARVCNDGCEAIQVIQSTLNPLVETAGVFTGQGHLPSECHAAASANPTGKVCFGLKMGTPQVGPNYWVSGDPEDPVFYNSCVRRTAGWTFNQVCSSCGETRIDPGFIFLKQCISCSEMRNNARPGAFLPQWDFTDSCRHCDFTQG